MCNKNSRRFPLVSGEKNNRPTLQNNQEPCCAFRDIFKLTAGAPRHSLPYVINSIVPTNITCAPSPSINKDLSLTILIITFIKTFRMRSSRYFLSERVSEGTARPQEEWSAGAPIRMTTKATRTSRFCIFNEHKQWFLHALQAPPHGVFYFQTCLAFYTKQLGASASTRKTATGKMSNLQHFNDKKQLISTLCTSLFQFLYISPPFSTSRSFSTWNELWRSRVDDVSTWQQIFNFFLLSSNLLRLI